MKIGNLIIDKDHINKRMDADLATYGELQSDYDRQYAEVQAKIEALFEIVGA